MSGLKSPKTEAATAPRKQLAMACDVAIKLRIGPPDKSDRKFWEKEYPPILALWYQFHPNRKRKAAKGKDGGR